MVVVVLTTHMRILKLGRAHSGYVRDFSTDSAFYDDRTFLPALCSMRRKEMNIYIREGTSKFIISLRGGDGCCSFYNSTKIDNTLQDYNSLMASFQFISIVI